MQYVEKDCKRTDSVYQFCLGNRIYIPCFCIIKNCLLVVPVEYVWCK